MADVRISGGIPPQLPAQRSDAARAAQRAFFQAALQGVQPTAPTPAPTAKPAAPIQTVAPTLAEPQRYLRPGSRLDIKV